MQSHQEKLMNTPSPCQILASEELEPRLAPSGLAATLTTQPLVEQAHMAGARVAAAANAASDHGVVTVAPDV